jgi:hypothetical protein
LHTWTVPETILQFEPAVPVTAVRFITEELLQSAIAVLNAVFQLEDKFLPTFSVNGFQTHSRVVSLSVEEFPNYLPTSKASPVLCSLI